MPRSQPVPVLCALVRARGVVTERALVDALAGATVRGSWWGHPKGKAIFVALQKLREDPDVFLCKLLAAKQTYVHRRLWPALLRVQAEARAWPSLSGAARRLLGEVERKGAVQATGRLRLELEAALRVVARAEHTASGKHVAVLTPFRSHFSEADISAAQALRFEEAQAALALPVVLPPRSRRRPAVSGLR